MIFQYGRYAIYLTPYSPGTKLIINNKGKEGINSEKHQR